jgi:hypothetical protein
MICVIKVLALITLSVKVWCCFVHDRCNFSNYTIFCISYSHFKAFISYSQQTHESVCAPSAARATHQQEGHRSHGAPKHRVSPTLSRPVGLSHFSTRAFSKQYALLEEEQLNWVRASYMHYWRRSSWIEYERVVETTKLFGERFSEVNMRVFCSLISRRVVHDPASIDIHWT